MKRFSKRLVAMVLALVMTLSLASCSLLDITRVKINGSDIYDDEETSASSSDTQDTTKASTERTEKPEPSSGSSAGSDDIVYPDHVPTIKEIHPGNYNGTVDGKAAEDLIRTVESDLIKHYVNNYADAVICFEHPENFGIDVSNVTWGDVFTDDDAEMSFVVEQLDKLKTVKRDSLNRDDKIAYDKMLWDLESEQYSLQYSAFDYYEAVFKPLTGPQCEILFVLDAIPVTTKEEAENYITLAKDLDRYYDDICKFEEERAQYGFASSDDLYEQVAVTFDNLVKVKDTCFLYDSFKTKLDAVSGLSASDKSDLAKRFEDTMKNDVFPEFEECAQRIRALKGSGGKHEGLCNKQGGDAFYTLSCFAQSNSSLTPDELKADIDDLVDSLITTLVSVVRNNKFNNNTYTYHDYTAGSVTENLDFLKDKVSADFPALHDHSYKLYEVPKDLEEDFSPAAYLGFHLDNFYSNQIIVNNGKNDTDLGVTCAHEGYPGHMFQSVYTRSVTKHPYMYVFGSIGYKEGWANYAETYSMKYYDSDKYVRTVVQIFDELNVLMAARCDIGIHHEGWDLNACTDYFNKVFYPVYNTNAYRASGLAKTYDLLISDPCYAVKYGSGFINTGKIIQAAHDQFPDKSDKEIHTAYLNALTGTFEQIKEYMFEELQ